MTVIIAMRETDDAILIAADGEATEGSALRLPFGNKLRQHPKGAIAWGASGNPTIGYEDFSPWLMQYSWPPKDWRTFRNNAIREFSRLNGDQRNLTKLAGKTPTEDDTATCLLVGWVGSPGIYEFNDQGKATSYWSPDGFHAIGSGKNHAYVAHRTLAVMSAPPVDKLVVIMQIVSSTAPGCGLPYTIWRVKENGIVNVETETTKNEQPA